MYKAIAYLVLSQTLWASHTVAGRFIVEIIDPFILTFLRIVLSVLLYPFVFGFKSVRNSHIYFNFKTLAIGFLGFFMFTLTLYLSLTYTSAQAVGFALGFTPVATTLIAILAKESNPDKYVIAGVLLSTAGAIMLTKSEFHLLGILGGFTASFIWASYSVIQNKLFPSCDRKMHTYAQLLLVTPLTLPLLVLGDISSLSLDFKIMLIIPWIALGSTVLPFYLWNQAIALTGASRASPFINLQPIITLILAYILLSESIEINIVIPGILIVTGSLLAMLRLEQNKHNHA